MPGKHSRQQSEATTSRRRETQARNNLVQAQAYQQRINNPSFYTGGQLPLSTPDQDVYEAYQASTAVPAPSSSSQQQSSRRHRRSASNADAWAMTEQYQQYQAAQQAQAQAQQQLQMEKETKTILDAKHRPSSGAWSMRDDHTLLTARMQGLNWTQIHEKHFPNKSANACRKRHERLIDSRGRGDSEHQRLERIASEYVEMREEIWRDLARKTGEKWTYVEKQV